MLICVENTQCVALCVSTCTARAGVDIEDRGGETGQKAAAVIQVEWEGLLDDILTLVAH